MSMTPEQMEKAERALHKVKMQEIQKRLALSRRMDCIEGVPFYNLPFRVLYSLKQSADQIELNRFYPHRAASGADCRETGRTKAEGSGTPGGYS